MVINKTVRSLILQWLKTHNCYSVNINLSIRTTTTKLGNQDSYIDIRITEIVVHLLEINKKLKERLTNDRLDNDQLNIKGKYHMAIDVRNLKNDRK